MLGQWPDAWTHLVLLQVWPMATGKSVFFKLTLANLLTFFCCSTRIERKGNDSKSKALTLGKICMKQPGDPLPVPLITTIASNTRGR